MLMKNQFWVIFQIQGLIMQALPVNFIKRITAVKVDGAAVMKKLKELNQK